MDNKNRNNLTKSLDYKVLGKELLRNIPLILVCCIIFSLASWFGYHMLVTPLYKSTATMYVNNRSQTTSISAISSISSADISASVKLVDTCEAIILNEDTLQLALDSAGLDKSIAKLQKNITVYSVNDTQVFIISATDPSADDAAAVVNAITEVLPDRFANIVEGSSVNLISSAKASSSVYSPQYVDKTIRAGIIGLLIGCAIVIIKTYTNNKIRNEDEFKQWNYPVLATIPDVHEAESREKYAYRKRG